MKKITALFIATMLTASVTGCSSAASAAAGDHLKKIQDAGTITVGLEGNWQPFCYHDETDTLVGFDVEVTKEIAKRLGVEVNFVEGEWDGLFTGLSTGTYDLVVNGVDVTEERQKSYYFTEPYAYDKVVLVVKQDNTEITSYEDLAGKKTANSTGSTYMEIGESFGAEVSPAQTLADTMTLVLNGQVDATINASTSVQDYLKTTGETGLKVVAELPETTAYAIPLPKTAENESLVEAINEAIKAMRADGTLAAISEKYFGADLTAE